jgi:hypothetical protein
MRRHRQRREEVRFLLLVFADEYVTPSLNKFLSPEPVWHEALL